MTRRGQTVGAGPPVGAGDGIAGRPGGIAGVR
jgi:hypothetical protein